MILISLKLKNYKKYQDFSIEFSEGLIGIIGKNGSGKSTIFDAIFFALYGDPRGEKESIKNIKASEKESVEVVLEFEIDSKVYKIIRKLQSKSLVAKAQLYQNKTLLSTGSKEVTKSISKLLGMSKEAFKHTVFANQKELTSLSELKSEDRKKMIRKLLNLEKIDRVEDEIRVRVSELKKEIKSFEKILLSEQEKQEIKHNIKILCDKLQKCSDEFKKIKSKYEKKDKEFKIIQKELQKLQLQKDDLNQKTNHLNILNQNLRNQNQNLLKIEKTLHDLNSKEQKFQKEKFIIDNYHELEKELKKLAILELKQTKKDGLLKEQVLLRDEYKKAKLQIQKLKDEVSKKEDILKNQKQQDKLFLESSQKLKDIEDKEKKLIDKISRLQALIDDTRSKVNILKDIGKDSNCPTCTRALKEEYDKVLNSLKMIIKDHQKELNLQKQELKEIDKFKKSEQKTKDKLQKILQELHLSLQIIKAKEEELKQQESDFKNIEKKGLENRKELERLEDIKYDKILHQKVIKSKQDIEYKYKELIGVKKLIEQIPNLKKDRSNITKDIEKIKKEIELQTKTIKDHPYDKSLHDKRQKEFDKIILDKDDLHDKLNKETKSLEIIKSNIKTLDSRLQTDKKQAKQLQNKIEQKGDYEKLKLLMSEFKNKINSKITPRITYLASLMYSTITKGKYQHVEVSSEFDFYIYDQGVKYPIARFSGGEIDLANLVLRIAISKTLNELNTNSNIGFLAFDEVFGSQDQQRRYEILNALYNIKEQYRQIFLISHENEIKEMFEKVIEIG